VTGAAADTLRAELRIARDHAAYAGHFPGTPVLPGAVLLDEVLREISRSRGIDLRAWRVANAKFLQVVRPGDALTLEHSASLPTIRFTVRCAGSTIASGVLSDGA
jgi:3-hydroxyacyl-[acyl-carrier-protein] dehydratase